MIPGAALSRLTAAALPVALLASGLVVLGSSRSEAGSHTPQHALQPYLRQDVHSVVASAQPVGVPLRLEKVPESVGVEGAVTRFSVQLPGSPVVVDALPVQDPPPTLAASRPRDPGWTSSATLTVPGGTPCGTYPVLVRQRPEAHSSAVLSAVSAIAVVGCPRAFEVVPEDEVATGEPLPVTFRGKDFPGHPFEGPGVYALRLLVDGEQVGPDIPTEPGWTYFHRRADLDLECGISRVEVVTGDGELLEERSLHLRCPAAVLAEDRVERTSEPRDVPLHVRDFSGGRGFEVELDGEVVSKGLLDESGAGSGVVPLPGAAGCGPHEVTVRQELPPVTTAPAFDKPVPSAPPPPPPGVSVGSVPRPGQPVSAARPVATPSFVLRSAVQPLPSQSPEPEPVVRTRTAEVTVPLTVLCDDSPSLEVTPPVHADDGAPARYELTGRGFSDDASVTVMLSRQDKTVPARTDELGRVSATLERRLPCGQTTFTARDDRERVAQDVVEVRCPALRLEPDTLHQRALPAAVTATASGFDGDAVLDVTLDGVDVGDARTDAAGRAVVTVPAALDLRCGVHRVALEQREPAPAPRGQAALTVVCPPEGIPVLEVTPDVVAHGKTAVVTARDLRPGPVHLLWRLSDGTQRRALPREVTAEELARGLDLLVLSGERTGPRRLLAVTGDGVVVGDVEVTLVVVNPVQPGRRGSRVDLLGRR